MSMSREAGDLCKHREVRRCMLIHPIYVYWSECVEVHLSYHSMQLGTCVSEKVYANTDRLGDVC